MKHFVIIRLGNKQNDIKHFKEYLPDKSTIDTICEAFAGSFSVIRNIYFDCKNIICSENDLNFRNQINSIFSNLDEYNKEKQFVNDFITNPKYLKDNGYFDRDKYKFVLVNQLKYLKMPDIANRGIFKKQPTKIKYDELKILYDKIKWYDDFKEVFELLKNNEKAFVFLDPPYFQSNNKNYEGSNKFDENKNVIDNTNIYIDIFEFMKSCKCKVMLIVNKSKLIHYMYKEFYKNEYNKIYGGSKNKEILMIYCNY